MIDGWQSGKIAWNSNIKYLGASTFMIILIFIFFPVPGYITSWALVAPRHFSVDQMPNYQIAKSEPETGPGQASTHTTAAAREQYDLQHSEITYIIQSYIILSDPGILEYVLLSLKEYGCNVLYWVKVK